MEEELMMKVIDMLIAVEVAENNVRGARGSRKHAPGTL